MLAASWAVLLVLTGILAIGFPMLIWGWKNSQFENLDAQMMMPFDDDDMRYERPWETADARAEREAVYGPLLVPQPGEWGGAR